MARDANDVLREGGEQAILDQLTRARKYESKPKLNGHANGKAGGHTTRMDAPAAVTVDDFYAYLPEKNRFIFVATGDLWPMESVDLALASVKQGGEYQGRGKRTIKASTWLARNRAVLQMTWWPGKPQIMEDVLVAEGGLVPRPGARIFNLYKPPTIRPGDADKAGPWLDHLKRIYQSNWEHLLKWFAHRVQRPWEKCNHAPVLTGPQGIGKDSLLEAVAQAIGPWNLQEIKPNQLMGDFNPYAKAVLLRINEAHDLGDESKFAIYERSKTLIAAPPDTTSVNEKFKRPYRVPNIVGVLYTSNYLEDALYLPEDDRRHYPVETEVTKEEFDEVYWHALWDWYQNKDGFAHVAALLHSVDLSAFNPKAPPPKTEAFHKVVNLNRPESDGMLADLIDALGEQVIGGIVLPAALTRAQLISRADNLTRTWLDDAKNRKAFKHGLHRCGYVPVQSFSKDGHWVVNGKRQAVYAHIALAPSYRKAAAAHLANGGAPYSLREWTASNGLNSRLKRVEEKAT